MSLPEANIQPQYEGDIYLRKLLADSFHAVTRAAHPAQCLRGKLPRPPKGRTIVVGAGKASAAMAAAFEDAWERPIEGIVLTRYGHQVPTRHVEIVEAGHPVPDEAGLNATTRLLDLLRSATPDDLIIGLFSGGGSSLLCAPAGRMTLADKQAVNRSLLASGAPIDAMNIIRKHLSLVKGGRLPLAAPQTPFAALVMSDVPGDDISTVASGPTKPDGSSPIEALRLVSQWRVNLPQAALDVLADPAFPTPKASDPRLAHVTNDLIMTPMDALKEAVRLYRREGFDVIFLGDDVEGEARDVGRHQARVALRSLEARKPVCILSGGETTVTLADGSGRGGRNTEFLLALALELKGAANVYALAADTDGIDGSEDNAGAFVTPRTLEKARRAGVDPVRALETNNAYGVFEAAGDLFVTGPTHTNVNDYRAVLVMPRD